MDNTQFIFWSILMLVAIGLDVSAYLFLRWYWKQHNLILTDELARRALERMEQALKPWQESWKNWVEFFRPQPLAVTAAEPAQMALPLQVETPPALLPQPAPSPVAPVEMITPDKISQKHGKPTHVEFSFDVPVGKPVELRIAADPDTGVTVEKRPAGLGDPA